VCEAPEDSEDYDSDWCDEYYSDDSAMQDDTSEEEFGKLI
jgi:hypothetical protein